MATATERARARVARRMATVTRVAGDKEGHGKGSKGYGNSNKEGNGNGNNTGYCCHNKGGRQATAAAMAMATARTKAMAIAMRWWSTRRAMARAARVMATAMRVAGKQQCKEHGCSCYNQKQCHDKLLGFCCLAEEWSIQGCCCCYLRVFLLLAGLSLFQVGQRIGGRRRRSSVHYCCRQIHCW